jgi:hypothetical protein
MIKKNKFSVVTTFNGEAYSIYAKKMLSSFDKFWPKEIVLYAYYEDMQSPYKDFSSKISFHNFNILVEDWYKFKKNFYFHELNKPDKEANSFYKYSAAKFAHKVYSIKKQLLNNNSDFLIWLDSDVVTLEEIPLSFFDSLIKEDCYFSYLGRDHINFHSEAGFMIFNKKHKFHETFWKLMSKMYDEGNLFKEKEWHDSYIFDVVRLKLEKESLKNLNITNLGLKHSNDLLNVFDTSVLGNYMAHFKGKRKFSVDT